MSLSDNIWNGLTGSNIHTIKVSAEQLASIINDVFIVKATSREEKDAIEKVIRGSKLFERKLYSADGKFVLFISHFQRGLTQHRFAFVKNFKTEEVYEWKGLNLGPLRRAVEPYLLQNRMDDSSAKPINSTISPTEPIINSTIDIPNDPRIELDEMLAAGMITKKSYNGKVTELSDSQGTTKAGNTMEQLKELQDMLHTGLITQEDYDNKKQELLKQM